MRYVAHGQEARARWKTFRCLPVVQSHRFYLLRFFCAKVQGSSESRLMVDTAHKTQQTTRGLHIVVPHCEQQTRSGIVGQITTAHL